MKLRKVPRGSKTQSEAGEEFFRLLFHHNVLPMWVCDLETLAFLDVNHAAVEKYGYAREEFLKMTLTDIRPSEDVAHLLDNMAKLRSELEHSGERRHTLRNGRLIDVEITSTTGEFHGRKASLVIGLDITERKRAEEALQNSERRLSSIYDTVGDMIFHLRVEPDGSYRYDSVNQAFCKVTGLSGQMVVGKLVNDVIPEPSLSMALQQYRKAIADNSILRWEETSDYPTGRLIGEVSIAPEFDDSMECVGLVGSVHDVTERKRAEEALRHSELRNRQLLESVTAYTYTVEIHNRRPVHTIHGAGCEKVTGYTPSDYSANPNLWLEMVHPDDRHVVEHYADPLCDGVGVEALEHRVLHKDGQVVWVRNTYVLKYNEDGKVTGYDGLISDITERKHAEEDIRRLNSRLEDRVVERTAQLEEANKELEAFSYSVSHDLRAPLRHASGFVDLLVKRCKPELSDKAQHYLSSIADSVHQMGVLIDDLLQLARTGRTEMRQSQSDMNEIVDEVLTSLRHDNPHRTIEWIIGTLPSVFCDKAMLTLAWTNLLSNAVKFTRTRESARIELGFYEENAGFVFFVRDNGVGFDMQYAQKLFGVFQRLHSVEEFEGTGVGLANVRRIISRHEGRTWAEAGLDKGATFYFTLPRHTEQRP